MSDDQNEAQKLASEVHFGIHAITRGALQESPEAHELLIKAAKLCSMLQGAEVQKIVGGHRAATEREATP